MKKNLYIASAWLWAAHLLLQMFGVFIVLFVIVGASGASSAPTKKNGKAVNEAANVSAFAAVGIGMTVYFSLLTLSAMSAYATGKLADCLDKIGPQPKAMAMPVNLPNPFEEEIDPQTQRLSPPRRHVPLPKNQ